MEFMGAERDYLGEAEVSKGRKKKRKRTIKVRCLKKWSMCGRTCTSVMMLRAVPSGRKASHHQFL